MGKKIVVMTSSVEEKIIIPTNAHALLKKERTIATTYCLLCTPVFVLIFIEKTLAFFHMQNMCTCIYTAYTHIYTYYYIYTSVLQLKLAMIIGLSCTLTVR